jgi:hypothetical protein
VDAPGHVGLQAGQFAKPFFQFLAGEIPGQCFLATQARCTQG